MYKNLFFFVIIKEVSNQFQFYLLLKNRTLQIF
jgi:hypothetical protein